MALLLLGSSGDIRETLGNPAESEYSASSINLARLRATNIVNAYVEKAYPSSTPFSVSGDVPMLLHTIATDLSVYYLKRDKHRGPAPMADSIKVEFWDKNIELLKLISEDVIELSELSSARGDTMLAPQSEFTPTFGESDETTWTIDSNKLEDDAEARD